MASMAARCAYRAVSLSRCPLQAAICNMPAMANNVRGFTAASSARPVQVSLQASVILKVHSRSNRARTVRNLQLRVYSTEGDSGQGGDLESESVTAYPIEDITDAVSVFKATTEPHAESSMESAMPLGDLSKPGPSLSDPNYVIWGKLSALKIRLSRAVLKALKKGGVALENGNFVLTFAVRDAAGNFKFNDNPAAVWVELTPEMLVAIVTMPKQPHKVTRYGKTVIWVPEDKVADSDITPGERIIGHISGTYDGRTITVEVTAARHIIMQQLVMSSLPALYGF